MATGANPRAAEYSLISTRRVWTLAFAFSGISSALVGRARGRLLRQRDSAIGDPYLFQSVVAVIVGGTVFGGPGDYTRTVVGALFLTVVNPCSSATARRRPTSRSSTALRSSSPSPSTAANAGCAIAYDRPPVKSDTIYDLPVSAEGGVGPTMHDGKEGATMKGTMRARAGRMGRWSALLVALTAAIATAVALSCPAFVAKSVAPAKATQECGQDVSYTPKDPTARTPSCPRTSRRATARGRIRCARRRGRRSRASPSRGSSA